MKRRAFVGAIAAAPLAWLPAPSGCRRRWPVRRNAAFIDRWSWVMGQPARLRLFHHDEAAGLEVAQETFAELRRVEALLSRFDEASALSELNRRAGRSPWRAPPEFLGVLRAAADMRVATGGAFDAAVEPLMRVWGFHTTRATAPRPGEVAEAEAAVRAAVVVIDGDSVHLPARHTQLDLGGIGVGYALDRAAGVLRANGVASALLDVSGDLIAVGAPPGHAGWPVDIADGASQGAAHVTVELLDRALATSSAKGAAVRLGTIERGHLMNPLDAHREPALRQATVLARTGLLADALSTALTVSGRQCPAAERVWLIP
jgi:thiamine biosynthesis lipoprotein